MNYKSLIAESLIPYLHGIMDYRIESGQLIPNRLDAERRVFASKELNGRALDPAGVRLLIETDSTWLELDVEPAVNVVPIEGYPSWTFDWVINGEVVQRETHDMGPTTLRVEGLDSEVKQITLYVFQVGPIGIKTLRYDEGAMIAPPVDGRPKWIFYGSSITQCGMAAGPAETWPAIVSRAIDVNHVNLGYGGNCKLEPMMARMIRDLDADVVVLALGINIQNGEDYSYYSFISNVVGLVQSIRDVKPETPIACLSPLYCESREKEQPAPALSLIRLRNDIKHAIRHLIEMGDSTLIYVDGLTLLDEPDNHNLSDGLHPDAEGYRIVAQRFIDQVVPLLCPSLLPVEVQLCN